MLRRKYATLKTSVPLLQSDENKPGRTTLPGFYFILFLLLPLASVSSPTSNFQLFPKMQQKRACQVAYSLQEGAWYLHDAGRYHKPDF
jgi:hypothetical protein